MSDIWSRAWCETQKIPNFAVKGITPSNEIRDAPRYLRPVTSEPTDHDSTCELSRSPSPDVSEMLCYKLRKKNKKKVKPPPMPPPCLQVTQKPRYGSEKIPNFKAPQSQTSHSNPKESLIIPAPLSPGRVRVHKILSRTPSTVSNGYQYRISSCSISPSHAHKQSTTVKLNSPEIDATFFCRGSTQPPSRNSAYSTAESASMQTQKPCAQNQEPSGLHTQTNAQTSDGSEELSGNAKTYIDQLEKENQQLKNLLLNEMPTSEDVSQGNSNRKCSLTEKMKQLSCPDNIMSKDRHVSSKHLLSGENCQIVTADTDRETVNNTRDGCVYKTKCLGKQSQKENPNHDYYLCSVPDLVKDIPQQLFPDNLRKNITQKLSPNNLVNISPQQMSPNNLLENIPQQLPLNKSPKSPKTQSSKQLSDEKQTNSTLNQDLARHKKSGFIFLGPNGEVLAESKGCSEGSEIVIKRMNENANNFSDKNEVEKSQQTENLKQISKSLEQTLSYQAFEEIQRYPCRQK